MAAQGGFQRGVLIALEFALAAQIYPFMLSSAFTARNIVQEKDDAAGVVQDTWWALGLSILAFTILLPFTHDWIAWGIGTAFAALLFVIYEWRGEIGFIGGGNAQGN
jgi:hypothetical protein